MDEELETDTTGWDYFKRSPDIAKRQSNASVIFFAGVAVILGMLLVVYTVYIVGKRRSSLTAEEMEQQRIASTVMRDAGLAGLLKEERVKIYRAFVEARSFPYSKPDATETTPDDPETTPDDPETPQEDISGKDAKACNCETEDDSDAPTCSICLNEYGRWARAA